MPFVPTPPQDDTGDNEEVAGYAEEAQELPLLDQSAEEQPSPADSPEAKLPPEAQGDVNGGPLGCCLGVIVGLLLSLAVAILSRLYADPLAQVLHGGLSVTVRIIMFVLAIAGAIVFGYFGWKIGKRFYREYEPPVIKDRTRKHKSKPKEA
jgi:hypothetical protein